MRKKKVTCVVGTRPEAIKMAPVFMKLRERSHAFETKLLSTGQHLELLSRTLAAFELERDHDLSVMTENQTLSSLTSRLFSAVDAYLVEEEPDLVLAQGDTTTVMVVASNCFYRGIPFGHVEAGLRTHNMQFPFPEEFNRRIASLVADLHFAPTAGAAELLRAERVNEARIFVTGNTVIDALYLMRDRNPRSSFDLPADKRIVLMTTHRRENFGPRMAGIFSAVLDTLQRHPDIFVVYPVHPNPNVRGLAYTMLGSHPRVHLCEPLDYPELVALMVRAFVVLTDSGGLQEEAPALGKPVLVLREDTERPEAVEQGAARIVGVDPELIRVELSRLLDCPDAYRSMVIGRSPYGDGHASERICETVDAFLAGELALA